MIHQDSEITISGLRSPWHEAPDSSGPATVPTFVLNELLSKLYGDVGRHPCAQCCAHDGVVSVPDIRGTQALVCEACASLSPVRRDYTITSRERELLVARAR